jgi:hypothetical protein
MLIMPTMFAKASTIPNAMAQVLVNATDKDGSILHEAEIRAAAKAHGVSLPRARRHRRRWRRGSRSRSSRPRSRRPRPGRETSNPRRLARTR